MRIDPDPSLSRRVQAVAPFLAMDVMAAAGIRSGAGRA